MSQSPARERLGFVGVVADAEINPRWICLATSWQTAADEVLEMLREVNVVEFGQHTSPSANSRYSLRSEGKAYPDPANPDN